MSDHPSAATTDGRPIEFDPVAADFLADTLMREQRADCYCAKTRKPCSEHQMYEAGMDDLINAIVLAAVGEAAGNGRSGGSDE